MVGLELTLEQRECVTRALEGQNFSIFGEAGTGKSLAISEICKFKGAEVQVICSTGIACEVFREYGSFKKKTITVHSFLGIGAAQEKFDSLVEKSTQNPDVRKRIKEAKCVIWDECSMSSSRVLELYQKITTQIRGNQRPFGGIQTIIVGDWLQLKPVSDKFDDGLSMFKSPFFRHLFPHTITLSIIHRQDATENEFISLLRKLRVGICDQEVKDSISSLKRAIDTNSKKEVHLYFTNVLVDAHNSLRLNEIPEERVTFKAGDKGDVTGAQWKVKSLAHFKVGAPIMVLYNVNNHIHNGSTGVFLKKLNEDSALIKLDSGGQYVIKKVCWTNVDQNGKVIGSRYQIPLRLNWASTVHKSQGLTLDKVVIHSSFEFTGGLLYTALSRVRSIEDVQVLEFRPNHVRTRMQELEEIKNLPTYGYENCSCFEALHNSEVLEKEEHYVDDISDEALYEMATQIFGGSDDQEQGNQEDCNSENEVILSSSNVNMEEMLGMTEGNERLFSKPPDDFDYKKFLKSFLNFEVPDTDGNNFGILKNSAINLAVHEIDKFILLIKIVWYKEFLLLHHYLKDNIADVRISTKDMKKVYQQCQDINRTSEYHSMLKICFQTGGEELTELAPHQMSIGFDILMSIFHNLLNVIVEDYSNKMNWQH